MQIIKNKKGIDLIYCDYLQTLLVENNKELSKLAEEIMNSVSFPKLEFKYIIKPTKAIGGIGFWKVLKRGISYEKKL